MLDDVIEAVEVDGPFLGEWGDERGNDTGETSIHVQFSFKFPLNSLKNSLTCFPEVNAGGGQASRSEGTAPSRVRVYSCRGLRKISSVVPSSMISPRYMTAMRSLTYRTVLMS